MRALVSAAASDVVQHTLVEPARATAARIPPAVVALAPRLDAGPARAELEGAEPGAGPEAFEAVGRDTTGEIARAVSRAATVRSTLAELVQLAAEVPDSIECLRLEPDAALVQGKVQSVRFRGHVDALIRHLMPPIELAARSVASALNQLPRR